MTGLNLTEGRILWWFFILRQQERESDPNIRQFLFIIMPTFKVAYMGGKRIVKFYMDGSISWPRFTWVVYLQFLRGTWALILPLSYPNIYRMSENYWFNQTCTRMYWSGHSNWRKLCIVRKLQWSIWCTRNICSISNIPATTVKLKNDFKSKITEHLNVQCLRFSLSYKTHRFKEIYCKNNSWCTMTDNNEVKVSFD